MYYYFLYVAIKTTNRMNIIQFVEKETFKVKLRIVSAVNISKLESMVDGETFTEIVVGISEQPVY